ncbi:hypothetical protein AOQ84DRAFT_313335 [Glonium stellatum]|uniref:F-box domain-containing protein n=1 Tax=Glonium stellatum TaxID=574774 RepID=A0A8E2JW20_9PEZI|nr:hypothetical protein AOQ84DRAFT_313335 [Glonium stellatum]
MDDALPSYETAITKDHWKIVARYIPSRDLCNAALVCQKWHEIFAPQLWGNPASHFGAQNDTVYVALVRFKRTLSWARLYVRQLTHTLHLPPAHAEIYGGPHTDWLRDVLERLPRLQSLIVNGLPFFDHASLLTLRYPSLSRRSLQGDIFPVYGLRLLDASNCPNATSMGLEEALLHLPDLISLDLSRTIAAKNSAVFGTLRLLPNLRVLKLRGLGLKDNDFTSIAISIGTRVRSLDVRDNLLTDSSARMLLDHCVKDASPVLSTQRYTPLIPVQGNWPLESDDYIGSENLEQHLRTKLTRGFVGRLAIEDAHDVGITHLYVSNNQMTVEGVSGLIRSKRLQVLDIGTLSQAFRRPESLSMEEHEDDFMMPGVEKLTQVLAECASERMVYLRINYAVVMEEAPAPPTSPQRTEMEGDLAVYRQEGAHELESTKPPVPELDAGETAVFELPGDTMLPQELHGDSPRSGDTNTSGSVPSGDNVSEPEISPITSRAPMIEVTNEGPQGSIYSHRTSTYYIEDRRSRLELRQSREYCLHPGMLPKMHTLVLTDVPTKTDRPEVIHRLIQFIKDCAEEHEMAKLRARFTYVLPPGRTRVVAEREYARSLFALRRIILEMAPPPQPLKKISTSWRRYPTKSSTEDGDTEAFWDAATHDFSFFGDEECGLPDHEPGRRLPLAAMSGLIVASPPPKMPTRQPENQGVPKLDIISGLSTFRKDRKAAFQTALEQGEIDPTIEGYWPGDITVVRQPAGQPSGAVDYYGNRFELGYRYR